METLFNILATPELASGVFPSTFAPAAPFWQSGDNVLFAPGLVFKLPGWVDTEVGTIVGNIGALAQEFTAAENRLYITTASNWYKWNGATLTGIGSGFSDKSWSIVPWETWLIGTNNVDLPQVWKNTGVAINLGGVPFSTAKIFKKLGPHLLAYNTSNGETMLEWASANQPEIWTPLAANSAGNLPLRQLDSGIVAVQDLRGGHAVYSQDKMMFVQWLNLNDGFSRRLKLNGYGAIGKHAVIEVASTNYGMGRHGIWVTDGVTADYLDKNPRGDAIGTFLQADVDWDLGETVIGWHDELHTTVRWDYTNAAGGRAGIGFNYKTGAWSILSASEFDFTIERQVFDTPIGAIGTTVYDLHSGTSADGVAIEPVIRSKPLGMEDDEQLKIVDALRIYLDSFTDVIVRLGTMDELDDAVVFHPDYTALATIDVLETTPGGTSVIKQARFFVIEFASETVAADWKLSGFKLLGKPDVAFAK